MSWLYDADSAKPKSEDYLLGKAVDANFERGTMGQINAVEYDCVPESIFASKAEHQVDIERKLQEDPLVTLRKTEVDTRKRLLDNPLKMREIQKYIDSVKKKTSKKKSKKKKKHHSDDDDEDLDRLLRAKLSKRVATSSEDSDDSDSPVRQPREVSRSKKGSVERRRKVSQSSSSDGEKRRDHDKSTSRRRRNESLGDERFKSGHDKRERHRNESPEERSRRHPRRNESLEDRRRHHRRNESPVEENRRRNRSRETHRNESSSDRHRRERIKREAERSYEKQKGRVEKHRKASIDKDDDREKRLREMMSNAKWRDEQRAKNVRQYEKEEAEEAAEVSKAQQHDPELVKRQLLMKAAESGSVQQRIQSNKYNIQRSGMDMDKNFARR